MNNTDTAISFINTHTHNHTKSTCVNRNKTQRHADVLPTAQQSYQDSTQKEYPHCQRHPLSLEFQGQPRCLPAMGRNRGYIWPWKNQ